MLHYKQLAMRCHTPINYVKYSSAVQQKAGMSYMYVYWVYKPLK